MTEKLNIIFVDDDPAEELIVRSLMKKVENYELHMEFFRELDSALDYISKVSDVFMVLLDNKLGPGEDFRGTVPRLRKSGFTGPVGIISSSLIDPYFQSIEEYGADFRIDKAEFDPTAIEFIIREYLDKTEPPL